jgi:hypothetical protein
MATATKDGPDQESNASQGLRILDAFEQTLLQPSETTAMKYARGTTTKKKVQPSFFMGLRFWRQMVILSLALLLRVHAHPTTTPTDSPSTFRENNGPGKVNSWLKPNMIRFWCVSGMVSS